MTLTKELLRIDPAATLRHIEPVLKEQVFRQLKRRGVVVGLSGGIDSSVTTALCARILGPDRVVALLMPEKESENDSARLGRLLAERLRVQTIVEDIAPLLEAAGCYRRRDEAIRLQVREYCAGYRCKIVLSESVDRKGFDFFHLVVESPEGVQQKIRLEAEAYLGIIAATNMKQRARKFYEYFHADRLNFAVAGTPNRLEYDQGFFVKNGDGAADLKPIAHLYKTQVYQLAEYLDIPEEIRRRPPTTDTYSLPQSQEEFYFSVPYEQMDLCLYGVNNHLSAVEVAAAAGLSVEQVERVYAQIIAKRRTTRYQHLKPLLIEDVVGPALE
jgi:NAD+ synthase